MEEPINNDVATFNQETSKTQELLRIENKLKELAEQGFTQDNPDNQLECRIALQKYYQFALDNMPKFINIPSDIESVTGKVWTTVNFKERDQGLLKELIVVLGNPSEASELSLKGAMRIMEEKTESAKRMFTDSEADSEKLMWTVYCRAGWSLRDAKGMDGGVGGSGIARIP